MTFHRTLLASTALSLSLLSNAAYADLTAAEVWGDWRSYLEGMGYTVTATEDASGDTLSVSDIVIEVNGTPDIDQMIIRMGSVQLVGNADGTVDVVMPPAMPVRVEVKPESTDAPTAVSLNFAQIGQKMTVSGDATAMLYDYAADTFELELTSLLAEGTQLDQGTAQLTVTGENIQSQTKMNVGTVRTYDQTMQAANIGYKLFFKNPEGVDSMSVDSTVQSITFAGTSAVPADLTMQSQDILPLLEAGFAFDGTFTTQGNEARINVTSEEGETKIKTGSAGSTLAIAMDTTGIRYDAAAEKLQIGAEIAGLPFPLFAEMAQTGFNMRAPVLKSDDPQDFTLAFNMTDFTMSDIIWALFDPSGQLPRDAATIALNLSGKAKVLADTMDAAAMQSMVESDTPPVELHALQINRLTVDAVGAKLETSGDLTFDNTDKTTFSGFPKPVGEVNVDLAGANALMDKLVAMGLLPAEQVMGARMMMGLFAVPGAEPDTLKSNIVFNKEGQVLANGQRLK